MSFKFGFFKVKITVQKDGSLSIEIEPWERKGGLTPPAPLRKKVLTLKLYSV